MTEPLFRVSAKAIIVEDDRLLVIHLRDHSGDFYYLPGGGQEYGETLTEALDRECREEIGCGVIAGPVMFVRDYFGWAHEFAAIEGHIHQLEVMVYCTIRDGERPSGSSVPDPMQVGHTWLPLADLPTTRFFPLAMRQELATLLATTTPAGGRYLGAIN